MEEGADQGEDPERPGIPAAARLGVVKKKEGARFRADRWGLQVSVGERERR